MHFQKPIIMKIIIWWQESYKTSTWIWKDSCGMVLASPSATQTCDLDLISKPVCDNCLKLALQNLSQTGRGSGLLFVSVSLLGAQRNSTKRPCHLLKKKPISIVGTAYSKKYFPFCPLENTSKLQSLLP